MKPQALMSTALIALAQASNFLVPLLLFPLYNRCLGLDALGNIAFCISAVQITQVISDYGFNLTGTRRVALGFDSEADLHRYVSSIQFIRMGIPAIGALLYGALLSWRPSTSGAVLSYWPIYLMAVGSALNPSWFLWGREAYRTNAIVTVVPRITLVALSYAVIPRHPDTATAMTILGGGYLATGLGGAVLLRYGYGVRWCRPVWRILEQRLREGFSAFAASLTSTVYTLGCTVLLGLLSVPGEVALYSAAEKLIKAAQFVVAPYAQYVYPRAAQLFAQPVPDWRQLRRYGVQFMVIGAVVSAGMLVAGPIILRGFYGSIFSGHDALPRLMALLPLIFSASLFLAQSVLIASGQERRALRCYLAGAVSFVAIAPMLMLHAAAVGAVMAVIAVECLVLALLYRESRRIRHIAAAAR